MNLDDAAEVEAFIAAHGTTQGRALAHAMGFKGKGAVKRANALSAYAWNKRTAMLQRQGGNIASALTYERICDAVFDRMDERDRW